MATDSQAAKRLLGDVIAAGQKAQEDTVEEMRSLKRCGELSSEHCNRNNMGLMMLEFVLCQNIIQTQELILRSPDFTGAEKALAKSVQTHFHLRKSALDIKILEDSNGVHEPGSS